MHLKFSLKQSTHWSMPVGPIPDWRCSLNRSMCSLIKFGVSNLRHRVRIIIVMFYIHARIWIARLLERARIEKYKFAHQRRRHRRRQSTCEWLYVGCWRLLLLADARCRYLRWLSASDEDLSNEENEIIPGFCSRRAGKLHIWSVSSRCEPCHCAHTDTHMEIASDKNNLILCDGSTFSDSLFFRFPFRFSLSFLFFILF